MGIFGSKERKSSEATTPEPQPEERVRATSVFTPSVPAELGFVGRKTEMHDLSTKGLRVPGTQVVIWGESGAGKSSLVNRVLEDKGKTAVKTACTPDSTYEQILEGAFYGTGAFVVTEATNHVDVTLGAEASFGVGSELIGAKLKGTGEYGTGTTTTRVPIARPQLTPQLLAAELGKRHLSWVIEDFHKVDEKVRDRIAHDLKIFSDNGTKYPDTRVIVLGVSESVEELVKAPTNMKDRLIDIHVPPLASEELRKILDVGEDILNLDFSVVEDRLLDTSVGTASVTHALALACCDEREVERAAPETVRFTDSDFDDAVASYARTRSGSLRSKFSKALKVHRKRKFANTELILRALTELPISGGTVGDILGVIRRDHPAYPSANASNYLKDLQGEERGALIRQTASGEFRFSEPLQHAFAKALFGGAGKTATDSTAITPASNAWDTFVNLDSGSFLQRIRAEIELIRAEEDAAGASSPYEEDDEPSE